MMRGREMETGARCVVNSKISLNCQTNNSGLVHHVFQAGLDYEPFILY